MYLSDELLEMLSPYPIYFNKVDLTQWVIPKQESGRGLMEREINTITVPGMPGSYVTGTRTPSRMISIPVLVACDSAEELYKVLEKLSEELHTDEPKPLQFPDEQDRTYHALYAGADTGSQYEGFYNATLNFLCSDPYKYGPPKVMSFTEGQAVIYNNGTVANKPKIRATVNEPITYMDVYGEGRWMRVGRPVLPGEYDYDPKTVLLNEDFNATTGWTAAGTFADSATITGAMASNGTQFYVTDFGEPDNNSWHGPALKTSIPGGPVQDFEMEWNVSLTNPESGMRGRIEKYFLDDQSQVIAKVAMKRIGGGGNGNVVEIRLGDTNTFDFFVSGYGGSKGVEWAQFRGIIKVSRKDNVWSAYVAMINPETGDHFARYRPKDFVDNDRKYMQQVAQVQTHMAKTPSSPASYMRDSHMRINRLNTEPEQIPYIAYEGDIIELDFKTSLIAVNGEPRPELKGDFGASFFSLPKGKTTLLIEPFESLDAEIEINEAFL